MGDEHDEYTKKFPEQFRVDYAISREQKNAAGQKMYIQTKMAEFAEELWELMQSPKTHIYMCGLKGMESGMQECFSPLAEKNGVVWSEFAKSMKKAKRYHVQAYFVQSFCAAVHLCPADCCSIGVVVLRIIFH